MELPESFYKNLLDGLYEGVYLVDPGRRITYWNKGAERITGYSSDEVVGRRCMDNILIHVDKSGFNLCRSACPLSKAMKEGSGCESEVFLHHKNGHRVPVHVRVLPLKDAAGRIIGGLEVFRDVRARIVDSEELDNLRKQALLDPLTELPNRRFAELGLSTRIAEFRNFGATFGLLFIDIDHFKIINDAFGHDAGDRVLKMVAQTLQGNLRLRDHVCRWGGDEFLALAESEDENRLHETADRLRMLVRESKLTIGESELRVTVSVGATLVGENDTIESLVRRADGLMYESKNSGRNRVTTSPAEFAGADPPA